MKKIHFLLITFLLICFFNNILANTKTMTINTPSYKNCVYFGCHALQIKAPVGWHISAANLSSGCLNRETVRSDQNVITLGGGSNKYIVLTNKLNAHLTGTFSGPIIGIIKLTNNKTGKTVSFMISQNACLLKAGMLNVTRTSDLHNHQLSYKTTQGSLVSKKQGEIRFLPK